MWAERAEGRVTFMSRNPKCGVKSVGWGVTYLCHGMERRHNKEDHRVLRARMAEDNASRTTLSFTSTYTWKTQP